MTYAAYLATNYCIVGDNMCPLVVRTSILQPDPW